MNVFEGDGGGKGVECGVFEEIGGGEGEDGVELFVVGLEVVVYGFVNMCGLGCGGW